MTVLRAVNYKQQLLNQPLFFINSLICVQGSQQQYNIGGWIYFLIEDKTLGQHYFKTGYIKAIIDIGYFCFLSRGFFLFYLAK